MKRSEGTARSLAASQPFNQKVLVTAVTRHMLLSRPERPALSATHSPPIFTRQCSANKQQVVQAANCRKSRLQVFGFF